MNTRKKYSKEFKLDAVRLVLKQDYTRAESASLSITPNSWGGVGRSMNRVKIRPDQKNGKRVQKQLEARRPGMENRRLKMKRGIAGRNHERYAIRHAHRINATGHDSKQCECISYRIHARGDRRCQPAPHASPFPLARWQVKQKQKVGARVRGDSRLPSRRDQDRCAAGVAHHLATGSYPRTPVL